MRRALADPNLDHFRLLTPRSLWSFSTKASVRFDTLLPCGIATLLESKRILVYDYYFQILPALHSIKAIKSVSNLYSDTGK